MKSVGKILDAFFNDLRIAFRYGDFKFGGGMKNPQQGVVFLFFWILLTSPLCIAFPIEPVSLRQLIERADLIILARVEPPPDEPPTSATTLPRIVVRGLREESPARLRPLQQLKGTVQPGLVEVHFDSNMVCPAPPSFPAGSNVLAFLRRRDDGKGFGTVALSYGAITVSDATFAAYSDRITNWLTLERLHPGGVPTNAIVEWLVRCVESPVTMWDGVLELANREPMLGTNTIRSPFAPHLNQQHWLRLSNVVFRSQFILSADLPLLRMFEGRAKPVVIQHLLACLERASKPIPPLDQPYQDYDGLPEPWNTFDTMWLLANQLDDANARSLMKGLVRTDFFSRTDRERQLAAFLPIVRAAAAAKGIK